MISKKTLLIAAGLALAVPSMSHAMTIQEQLEAFSKMAADIGAAQNKEMEDAKAEAKRIAEESEKKEASLKASIESVNKLLADTRLEKKAELTAAIADLDQKIKAAYAANQKRLAEERKLNERIVKKHYKRVKYVSKAMDALVKIVKA